MNRIFVCVLILALVGCGASDKEVKSEAVLINHSKYPAEVNLRFLAHEPSDLLVTTLRSCNASDADRTEKLNPGEQKSVSNSHGCHPDYRLSTKVTLKVMGDASFRGTYGIIEYLDSLKGENELTGSTVRVITADGGVSDRPISFKPIIRGKSLSTDEMPENKNLVVFETWDSLLALPVRFGARRELRVLYRPGERVIKIGLPEANFKKWENNPGYIETKEGYQWYKPKEEVDDGVFIMSFEGKTLTDLKVQIECNDSGCNLTQ